MKVCPQLHKVNSQLYIVFYTLEAFFILFSTFADIHCSLEAHLQVYDGFFRLLKISFKSVHFRISFTKFISQFFCNSSNVQCFRLSVSFFSVLEEFFNLLKSAVKFSTLSTLQYLLSLFEFFYLRRLFFHARTFLFFSLMVFSPKF